jgi:hypothetical protein
MAMPAPHPACPASVNAQLIGQAHQLYNELTGQTLRLGFDRERQWFELLRAGYTLADLRTVILYLQREIRGGRRYVGALKLSNLLQPDRFEEDLHISRVRLRPPSLPKPLPPAPPPLDPAERERRRLQTSAYLQQLKASLSR